MKILLILAIIYIRPGGADIDNRNSVSVSIGPHQHINVNVDNPNLVATIDRVFVCSSVSKNIQTIDPVRKCGTDGFIQYDILGSTRFAGSRTNRVYHPHIERVTTDHYYAQVHLKVFDKTTGKTVDDICLVRVNVLRKDMTAIIMGCVSLTVICAVAFLAIYRKKRIEAYPYASVNDVNAQIADDLGLYSTISL